MAQNVQEQKLTNSRISEWDPENETLWNESGKKHAMRNLWISIPCLLCGFAVWLYWSIIIVQMQNLSFPFSKDQLYTLTAVAGLVGATLRIPNSFFIALSGGRNVIAVTTALLILPSIGAGIALQDINTPYSTFVIFAALSGLGGGAFASSMSNISFFFPKRMQGLSLGLNAGLGNVGVSIMQVLLPFVMTFGVFGAWGGSGLPLPEALGGGLRWIQNCGLVWVPVLGVLAIMAWFGMDNLPIHNIGAAPKAIVNMLWLLILGFVAGGSGLYLLIGMGVNMWIVLPITIALTLFLMRYLTPVMVRENLAGQFVIFSKKHNWVMTWLYTMTFGSFIGYSAAFPKLIQDVFGSLPDGSLNPNAPNPLAYAWLGPLVGSLIRPVGGWLSDKLGGARVTHWDTILMILSALGVAYYVKLAGTAAAPEQYFIPFLLLFLLLFITTGIGNGSTFRMIPIIFESKLAGPVLGWTSAVAAYGAFIIPKVFGGQIQVGTPENALYGFALYYTSCLVVNWWFYARKNAEIPC
ncbi:MAG: antiporter [Candidatus Latescibacteria bacterium]|jgi:MFS transporter, NNP family, nitrate/nitrite transporter|nr:antiporter [Candidatus Latescibacterota bacterium]